MPSENSTGADEQRVLPLVSVIMPVRNEQKAIRRSLSAVLAQSYPPSRLEVLVADGVSDDDTRTIVKELAAHDPRVRLVDNRARIMAAGFNAALASARGEVVIMLGGHSEIAPDYVRKCVEPLSQGRADCVGGAIETIPETREAAAISLAMSSTFGVGGSAFRTGAKQEKYVDTVAFGAYTREIIERAGVLDEEMVRNQDDEYNYRLRKLGARILFVPDVCCRYYSRPSLGTLWRQYYKYGYWKVRVMQKHPRQMRLRQFAPFIFVAALITALLLALASAFGKWVLGLLVTSYLVANLAASTLITRKEGWHVMPLLPLAFATLHLSYGLGFAVGLISFWNRWAEPEVVPGHPRPSDGGASQA